MSDSGGVVVEVLEAPPDRPPRVFIPVAPGRQKIEGVERWGRIETVLGAEDRDPYARDLDRTVAAALEAREYDPARDWLLMAGPMVPAVFLVAIAVSRYGWARVLLYDGGARRYFESRVVPPTSSAGARAEPNPVA